MMSTCMSCKLEIPREAKLALDELVVCPTCYELAERAWAEIKYRQDRATAFAKEELRQLVMRSGLLKKGSGLELPGFGQVPRGN